MNQQAPKHFLITGATGYIGAHVAREILSSGHTVSVLTRDVTKGQGKTGVHQNLTYLPFNLSSVATLQSISDQITGATLIDLAWEFDGKTDHEQVREHLELANQCIRLGISKIVSTGTLFEFNFDDGQIDENSLRSGTTQHGLAKIELHDRLEVLTAAAGVPFLWARFHYVFGNDEESRSVFGQILREPKPFQIKPRDGLFDFIEVSSLAQQFRRALDVNAIGILDFGSGRAQSFTRAISDWLERRELISSDYLVDPNSETSTKSGTWPGLAKLSQLLQGRLSL